MAWPLIEGEPEQVQLSTLRPTDIPRSKNWARTVDLYPTPNSISPNLFESGIYIYRGYKYPFVVKEGNHRIARAVQFLGLETIVTLRVLEASDYERHEFDDTTDEIAQVSGISTYSLFLSACLRSNFPDPSIFSHLK